MEAVLLVRSPFWPLSGFHRPSALASAAGAGAGAEGSGPVLKEEKMEEEEREEQRAARGWTAEQLDIVSTLLQTPPRPFSTNRASRPPRVPSKHRHVAIPTPRMRFAIPTSRPGKDKHFLTRLSAQISDLSPHAHVSDILHRVQHLLTRGSLSATIRELGHLGLPLRALEILEWQKQCSHLWPDERTLFAAIEVIAEAGMEERAWDLLHTHAPLSSLAFTALARGLTAAGLFNRAMLAKEKAESSRLVLGQGVYAELILLASRLNKLKEMIELIHELGSFPDLQLGLEHYTSVMAACRKAQMYDAVLDLFQWWKQAGFFPNVVMYQIVMTSLSDLGKHRDALAIYWEMEKGGCDLHLPTYIALFEVCAQLGDASRALRLFTKMRESNITPTHNIYTNLIKVCYRDGRFGKAKEFKEAMRKEGLPVEDLDKYANL